MFRFTRTCATAALALTAAWPLAAQETAPAPESPEAATPAAPAAEVTADTVLATVNGTPVTAGHLIALRRNLPDEYQSLPDQVLLDGLLEQIIQQRVLAADLREPTAVEQLQMENQETAMAAGLVVERILARPITEEALQAAYDARFASAEPEKEYNASHILVPTREEADAIVADLRGGGDFAAIAREKSQDPGSGANGGLLGWFGPGMMVKPFEDAVVGAEVGTATDPIETQFGWHIILVNETRVKEAPALDAVREELEADLRDKAVQQAIEDATQRAQIERSEIQGLDPSFLRNEDLLNQ